jgi:predicted MFS family arabinose efflux permease
MISSTEPAVRTVEVEVARARTAVYIAFSASGFAFASWAARIPQVKHALALDPGSLGLVLLSLAVGSVISLPLAGIIVTRIGAASTITIMALVLAVGLGTVAIGYRHGVVPVVVGLWLVGFSNGIWDVAMNVEGAAVEQRLGRSIMSRFHAGWSLGTVAGALIGAALVAGHVSVTVHLLSVSVVVALAVPYAVRGFLPAQPEGPHDDDRGHPLQAWTEPRTLLIGLFVLSAAFAEGTGNDWLGVVATDGYHASASAGALTLAIFLAAMTTGRWFGVTLLDRYGRVPVLRSTVAAAVAGLLLVVFGGSLALAMVGCVFWGLGASLGFPVGMSAAADDPVRAAGRVSVVASIGYVAFLAGPPIVGLLGDHVGVRHALTATIAVLGLGLLVSGATRPLSGSEQDAAVA